MAGLEAASEGGAGGSEGDAAALPPPGPPPPGPPPSRLPSAEDVPFFDPGMDTPLTALPAPTAPEVSLPPTPPGSLAFARAGMRHALRCMRPLVAVLIVQLLLALTVVLPFHAAVANKLDAHPHAAALAGAPTAADRALGWEAGMDAGLWRDTKRELGTSYDGLPVQLVWTLLLAWLFGAVAAAGFLGLAVEPGPCSTTRFFALGGKGFFRMLRVGLVFACAFVLVGRLVYEGWGAALADREAAAASESTKWWGERAREVTLFVLFLVLRVAADLARADLIAGGRRSALLAFLRRLGTLVARPLTTLGVAVLLGAPAFGALWLLSRLATVLPQGGWQGPLALFLLLQVAVLLRWASRAALLGAFAARVLPGARTRV